MLILNSLGTARLKPELSQKSIIFSDSEPIRSSYYVFFPAHVKTFQQEAALDL
jgi:hypothetical protein